MHSSIQKFADKVTGTLECFERVIFKGHIQPLSFAQGMEHLLARHGLLIKDFARFVQTHSDHHPNRGQWPRVAGPANDPSATALP